MIVQKAMESEGIHPSSFKIVWKFVSQSMNVSNSYSILFQVKEDFGHNVPQQYTTDNPSLENWCKDMRCAYKKIHKGMKTKNNLLQDRIERLEEIGFQWSVDYIKA